MTKSGKPEGWRVGDVFALEIAPGEFAFGRILLGVGQALEEGHIDTGSYLFGMGSHDILVEIYREIRRDKCFDACSAEVLFSRFTTDAAIELNRWEIIGHAEVEPETIDFPEFLSHEGAFEGKFIKGEIAHIIEITHQEVEELHLYRKVHSTNLLPKFILFALGRTDECRDIPASKMHRIDIAHNDLRYSDHRERICSLLPEEFRKPYYEMAKEKGFDLARLYG